MTAPRNELVAFGEDKYAPTPPDIGIAVSLSSESMPPKFNLGQPVVLHGAYRADLDLIRLCRSGLISSVLLTIIRTDRPWGETARLITLRKEVSMSRVEEGVEDPTYREREQFTVDLVKFFRLPREHAKYTIQASLGPYFSERIAFEIK